MKDLMEFLDELYNIATKPKIWSFVVYCLVLGLIVVLADFLTYRYESQRVKESDAIPVSYFAMNYSSGKGILIGISFWCVGSAIVGYLTAMANMIDMSYTGALLVCVGWPFLFSKIVKSKRLEIEKDNH